ncbi:signal recognition particle receptor subunit beta [Monosporozyma unispora]|nr:hypothetical protein C6P44_000477 [Kazachstania unispora]
MLLDISSSTVIYSIIATIVIILITGLWLVIKLQNNNNNTGLNGTIQTDSKTVTEKPTIAIMGPMNVGKTTLFNYLTTTTIRPCVTSQEVSMWPRLLNGNITLIEFPGHIKLQYKWQTWLSKVTENVNTTNLKGIIFVVDSTLSPEQWDKPAELLVDILEEIESLEHPTSVLIACNKNESFTARPPQKIKQFLEQKIGEVLARRKASLATGHKSNASRNNRGGDDEDQDDYTTDSTLLNTFANPLQFRFDALETSVEALAGSVLKKNVDSWQQWLEDHE